jgi:hypothetical protein
VVESSALLKRRTPKGYRGFESLPHRACILDFYRLPRRSLAKAGSTGGARVPRAVADVSSDTTSDVLRETRSTTGETPALPGWIVPPYRQPSLEAQHKRMLPRRSETKAGCLTSKYWSRSKATAWQANNLPLPLILNLSIGRHPERRRRLSGSGRVAYAAYCRYGIAGLVPVFSWSWCAFQRFRSDSSICAASCCSCWIAARRFCSWFPIPVV